MGAMPEHVTVRPMLPTEFDDMRRVSVAAFDDDSIGVLLDALRAGWSWIDELSYVAEVDGEIVAQVLYTHATLDAPDRLVDVLLLSPVGVLPHLHGQGIGSQLIRESMAQLGDRPEPLVFLEGNPVYYERFGFVAGGDHGFIKPSQRIPDAAFQVVALEDGALDIYSGTLVYPDAFWRTDSVGLR